MNKKKRKEEMERKRKDINGGVKSRKLPILIFFFSTFQPLFNFLDEKKKCPIYPQI